MGSQIRQLRRQGRGKLITGRRGRLALAAAVVTATAAFMAIPGTASAATPAAQSRPATAGSQSAISSLAFGASPGEQDPAKCYIHYEPKEPHLRASHNHNAVGVKPYVKCARSVQLIVLYVQMYKYHFFGLLTEKVGRLFPDQSKHNVAYFQQKNVAVACTNKDSTKWFAITSGKVLENGKWYYNSGYRSENRVLACGT